MAVLGQGGGVVRPASHGPVPGPDEGVSHHEGDVVGVGPAGALHGDGDVGVRHGVVADAHVGAWRMKEESVGFVIRFSYSIKFTISSL